MVELAELAGDGEIVHEHMVAKRPARRPAVTPQWQFLTMTGSDASTLRPEAATCNA